MKKLELLRELAKLPVFSNKTVRDLIGKSSQYTRLVVYRMKREKLIKQIEKNKYTLYEDPLLVASNISWPSYISCWAALSHHHLTEQLPTAIHVVTTRSRKRRELEFENARIIFIKTSPSRFFGFEKVPMGGLEIFMAEPEKALIDSALFHRVSFSEISEMVEKNLQSIDTEKLLNYLIRVDDGATAKRFGYLLERLGIESRKKLRKFVGKGYTVLDYALPTRGRRDERWMVRDNVDSR
jgi:predicted transcriptional regulator of viral defense system